VLGLESDSMAAPQTSIGPVIAAVSDSVAEGPASAAEPLPGLPVEEEAPTVRAPLAAMGSVHRVFATPRRPA
jgi:hypothetical protein